MKKEKKIKSKVKKKIPKKSKFKKKIKPIKKKGLKKIENQELVFKTFFLIGFIFFLNLDFLGIFF